LTENNKFLMMVLCVI